MNRVSFFLDCITDKHTLLLKGEAQFMKPFVPQLVYIEPKALEYPLGRELKQQFEEMNIEISHTQLIP